MSGFNLAQVQKNQTKFNAAFHHLNTTDKPYLYRTLICKNGHTFKNSHFSYWGLNAGQYCPNCDALLINKNFVSKVGKPASINQDFRKKHEQRVESIVKEPPRKEGRTPRYF